MKSKKKLFGVLAIVIVIGVTFISCSNNQLKGTWIDERGDVITFGRKTIIVEGGGDFTYTTNGNSIRIVNSHGDSETFTFYIDADILFITNGEHTDRFTRRR